MHTVAFMVESTTSNPNLSSIAQEFQPFKTKNVFYRCYKPVEGKENKWLCMFCEEEKSCNVKHGYNNGLNHLKTHNWRLAMIDESQTTLHCIVDDKSHNVCQWLKWVINLDLPFSFVNKKETRESTKLKSIDRNSITKYMHRVVLQVECYFQGNLPENFGTTIDSWSCFGIHYCGVYAVYATEEGVPVKLLLALSVFESEQSFGSDAHRKLLEATLKQYNRDINSVMFITADNCSTNKALVNIIGIPISM